MGGGVPLSFRERWAVDKQKSEGLVSVVVEFAVLAFDGRFSLNSKFGSPAPYDHFVRLLWPSAS